MLIGLQHVQRRKSLVRIGNHGDQHSLEPLEHCLDVVQTKLVGVVLDANPQLMSWQRHHRQRIVVVLASDELGDGQFLHAHERTGVNGVALVQEEGVEQLFMACDMVNLVESQMLMLDGLVVGTLQLSQ
ncbi:Uncharacterised protein [Mycobacteroides abscessus subsp. abscessus]|nr:Uncharacterised protein [Mycobacteroides abscessus subsp. abscessus]